MLGNAREIEPTLDQSKLARSRLLVADAFTRDRAAAEKPDPHDTATWLLDQLQALGWKQPPDPAADIPPLRPDQVAGDDSPGPPRVRRSPRRPRRPPHTVTTATRPATPPLAVATVRRQTRHTADEAPPARTGDHPMLTTLLAIAATWTAIAIPAAILIGRALAQADREQRAHAAQRTAVLRSVA